MLTYNPAVVALLQYSLAPAARAKLEATCIACSMPAAKVFRAVVTLFMREPIAERNARLNAMPAQVHASCEPKGSLYRVLAPKYLASFLSAEASFFSVPLHVLAGLVIFAYADEFASKATFAADVDHEIAALTA